MATDPAVQAAQLLHELSDRHFRNCINICQGPTAAEKKTAALIRRQALIEAAEAIDKLVSPQLFGIDREQQRIRDGAFNDAIHAAYRLVRGLGEGTDA